MEYSKIIKEVGRGKNHARDLDEETARALYARMLNGEVPELELGGILIALRIKGEGEAEMKGFYAAMQQHTLRLTPPAGKPMPIVDRRPPPGYTPVHGPPAAPEPVRRAGWPECPAG